MVVEGIELAQSVEMDVCSLPLFERRNPQSLHASVNRLLAGGKTVGQRRHRERVNVRHRRVMKIDKSSVNLTRPTRQVEWARTPSSLSAQFKANKDYEHHCLLCQGEQG